MWPRIRRARRSLTRSTSTPPTEAVAGPSSRVEEIAEATSGSTSTRQAPTVGHVEDEVIIMGSQEIDRLRAALERLLGDAVERPDTPARIERALSLLLAERGDPGKPRVLRRPAGLSTPESWEIHLDGVDQATGSAVRQAGRTGVLVS